MRAIFQKCQRTILPGKYNICIATKKIEEKSWTNFAQQGWDCIFYLKDHIENKLRVYLKV